MEMPPYNQHNQHSSRTLGLNPLALVAVIVVAVALSLWAYFDFRSKQEEAKSATEMMKAMQGLVDMNAQAQKNLEEMQRKQQEEEMREKQRQRENVPPPAPTERDPLLVDPPQPRTP